MRINAPIFRKEANLEPARCQVEKVIQLTDAQYYRFANNMLRDYDFIKENHDLMWRDEYWHCLLVVGETQSDGILVQAEGSDYARYTGFVPNARQLIMLRQLPPDFQKVMEKAPEIAHWLIKEEAPQHRQRNVTLEQLEDDYGIELQDNLGAQDILCHVLSLRPEIHEVELDDDILIVSFQEQVQRPTESPVIEPEMT